MGHGDELMAIGQARELRRHTGKNVIIGRHRERPTESPMFENIAWINPKNDPDAEVLMNYPGRRPYLDYSRSTGTHDVYAEAHRALPGMLHFSLSEGAWAMSHAGDEGFIAVEPHVKGLYSGENKAWPWAHWQRLVNLLRKAGHRVVQISAPALTRTLDGAERFPTPDVREALALLSRASAVVTTDGLLHHAAAALDVPAVVLWARSSPLHVGYPSQSNIVGAQWCGARTPCDHCREGMLRIDPDAVAERVGAALAVS